MSTHNMFLWRTIENYPLSPNTPLSVPLYSRMTERKEDCAKTCDKMFNFEMKRDIP